MSSNLGHEIRESEARLRALVDSVADYAILLLDTEGRVQRWNSGAERLYGHQAAEILGEPVDRFYPPEQARGLRDAQLGGAREQGRAESEGWRVRRNGSRMWANEVITALHDEQGRLSGFVAVTRDLTERKRAEAELSDRETRLRTLVQAVADAIVVVNAQGRVESFNPAAERTFGYGPEAIAGRDARTLFAGSPGITVSALLRQASFAMRKDGSRFPVEISMSEMTIGGERKFTAVVRDVTARVEADTRLHQLNHSLQTQVHETTETLTRLRETQAQLVQAEKMASLGRLVAGVAHEINTPVGVGVTAASILQDEAQRIGLLYKDGKLQKKQLEHFLHVAQESSQLVLSNLQRAATLIESFKLVSVDQSSGQRRKFELRPYLEEVMRSLAPRLKQTGHEVIVECPAGVNLDSHPGAIAQILTNLVDNAVTHGFAPGRKGTLRITAARHGENVELHFADDGAGIDPQHLAHIFDPFFTTRRGSGGSGLGLHIVFNLVSQLLGGSIEARSVPEQGAEFVMKFSLKAPD